MGLQAMQQKIDGIELSADNVFDVKMNNKKLQFLFSENDFKEYSYSELDFKNKIEALL